MYCTQCGKVLLSSSGRLILILSTGQRKSGGDNCHRYRLGVSNSRNNIQGGSGENSNRYDCPVLRNFPNLDRKADHPFLTTLFLAPVVGGRLVYLLLLFMLLLGASCGAGAAAIGYVGTTYPLVKESVLVAIETKEHEIADRVVDRLARKLEWPRG